MAIEALSLWEESGVLRNVCKYKKQRSMAGFDARAQRPM